MTIATVGRSAAALGLLALISGGVISAYRQEEIYVICSVVWIKNLSSILQAIGLASWSLGVFLVMGSLVIAAVFHVQSLVINVLAICLPRNSTVLQVAGITYLILALEMAGALVTIFTDGQDRALFRAANGPLLSPDYFLLPFVFIIVGATLCASARHQSMRSR